MWRAFTRCGAPPSVTDADWDLDLAVNLDGPFYPSRAALPHLLESGGNIVNVPRWPVSRARYLGRLLRGQARTDRADPAMAVEFTEETLRVNAVCPGGMLTAQVTEFAAPEDADWDLIMRIAAPRGMMDPVDVGEDHRFPGQ